MVWREARDQLSANVSSWNEIDQYGCAKVPLLRNNLFTGHLCLFNNYSVLNARSTNLPVQILLHYESQPFQTP